MRDRRIWLWLAAVLVLLSACAAPFGTAPSGSVAGGAPKRFTQKAEPSVQSTEQERQPAFSADVLPEYNGEPYVAVNGNEPFFADSDLTVQSFETYSPLDDLGRCGPATASVGLDLMPTQERGSIREVRPSGWKQAMYDFVDGGALYNRCHLIGWQLTAEDANADNLITGTRYLNVQGMLPFENMVADYVRETGNHVLYRVTPIFQDDELVARGVLMEGKSVEDDGEGVLFCTYAFNVQPGVEIDYRTGKSRLESEAETAGSEVRKYVVNTNTGKFHLPDCASVTDMNPANRLELKADRDTMLADGYRPCGICQP